MWKKFKDEHKVIYRLGVKIFLFSLIFLILNFSLPLFFLQAIDGLKTKNAYQMQCADVLIMGDSHVSFGIDPELFKNIGLTAVSYAKGDHYSEFNYYLYREFVDKCGPPKAVIISTPYFFLTRSTKGELYRLMDDKSLLAYYFKNNTLSLNNFFQYNQIFQGLPNYIFQYVRQNKVVLPDFGYAINCNPDFISYDMSQGDDSVDLETMSTNKIDYLRDGYSKYNPKNKRFYDFFSKLLMQISMDGEKVFLVEAPEYKSKLFWTGEGDFYREMDDEVLKYENAVFVKKTAIKSIDSNDKTLFFNGGISAHLSFKGSKLYTEELLTILKEELAQ